MTSMLLVLLLLAQTEGPDNPPAGAMELPRPASSARRLHYLARLEATGFALLPDGGTGGVERYVQLTPMITGALVRWRCRRESRPSLLPRPSTSSASGT